MSNSGIDFFKRRKPVKDSDGDIIYFVNDYDKNLWLQIRDELNYIEANKGKFVPVYDDITGRQLTDLEVAEIEEQSALRLPYIIIEKESDLVELRKALIKENKKGRRYKSKRVDVSTELREKVFNKDQHRCRICGNVLGLELAHIDRNSSHTWESNLMTLCSECHLTYDHKRPYSHKNKENQRNE